MVNISNENSVRKLDLSQTLNNQEFGLKWSSCGHQAMAKCRKSKDG